MNLDQWADGAWADGSWVPASWGIGLVAETGIGLAPIARPVDIVLESPHWRARVVTLKQSKKIEKNETSELQEMMRIYAQWRTAA